MGRTTVTLEEHHERTISELQEPEDGPTSDADAVRSCIEDAAELHQVCIERDELAEALEAAEETIEALRPRAERAEELETEVRELRQREIEAARAEGQVEELREQLRELREEKARLQERANRSEAMLELHESEKPGLLSRTWARLAR